MKNIASSVHNDNEIIFEDNIIKDKEGEHREHETNPRKVYQIKRQSTATTTAKMPNAKHMKSRIPDKIYEYILKISSFCMIK